MEIMKVPLGKVVLEHKLFAGVPFPILCPGNVADHLQKIQDMECRPDDVYIMSLPRSGTHWIREIVYMLMTGKAEYILNDDIDFPFELVKLDTLVKAASPRVFYSHMPFRYLPHEHLARNGKVIGCFRDPKDIVTSHYHFFRKIADDDVLWDQFYEAFVDGKLSYGCWFDWRDQWEETLDSHKDNPPLTVTYEDTSKDLEGQVRKIADYLGVAYNDNLIANITEACRFHNMRAAKSKTKSDMMKRIEDGIKENKPAEPAKDRGGNTTIIRKGVVGDWKTHFTDEQLRRLNDVYIKRTKPGRLLEFKEYLENATSS